MMHFLLGLIVGVWSFAGYIRYHDAKKTNGRAVSLICALGIPFEIAFKLLRV